MFDFVCCAFGLFSLELHAKYESSEMELGSAAITVRKCTKRAVTLNELIDKRTAMSLLTYH